MKIFFCWICFIFLLLVNNCQAQFNEFGYDSVAKVWNVNITNSGLNLDANSGEVTGVYFDIENLTAINFEACALELTMIETGKKKPFFKQKLRIELPYDINPGDIVRSKVFYFVTPYNEKQKFLDSDWSYKVLAVYPKEKD